MWDIEGLVIQGCNLKNTMTTLPAIDQRGGGIISASASYNIDRYKVCAFNNPDGSCASYSINVATNFNNLMYGVNASGATPYSAITINDNDFTNCNRSVYFSNIAYGVVTRNRMNVAKDGTVNGNAYFPYGIYLETSYGYKVEENNITTTIANNTQSTGIAVYKTGGNSNIIYNNTINAMYPSIVPRLSDTFFVTNFAQYPIA
jgi:hypothetical protein